MARSAKLKAGQWFLSKRFVLPMTIAVLILASLIIIRSEQAMLTSFSTSIVSYFEDNSTNQNFTASDNGLASVEVVLKEEGMKDNRVHNENRIQPTR